MTNINAKVFQNVKLFASDNYYNPSVGSIKNVKWLNIGMCIFFFQAEDGIRDSVASRGLGDVYKRQNKNYAYRY